MARPRCRPPRAGESRRASPICAAMLRWTLVLRCWPAGCAAVWAAAKATVSLACAAAQADFILSSWVIWSMSRRRRRCRPRLRDGRRIGQDRQRTALPRLLRPHQPTCVRLYGHELPKASFYDSKSRPHGPVRCLMQEHQAWPPAVRPQPPWNPAASREGRCSAGEVRATRNGPAGSADETSALLAGMSALRSSTPPSRRIDNSSAPSGRLTGFHESAPGVAHLSSR